jgi:sentrin-specific protease 1
MYSVEWQNSIKEIANNKRYDEVRFDGGTFHGFLVRNEYPVDSVYTAKQKLEEFFEQNEFDTEPPIKRYGTLTQILIYTELGMINRMMLKPGGTLVLPIGYMDPINRLKLKNQFVSCIPVEDDEAKSLQLNIDSTRMYLPHKTQEWVKLIGYIDPKKTPLTVEELERVDKILKRKDRWSLVANKAANIILEYGHANCLKDSEWLNDEVVNLYFQLLKERSLRTKSVQNKILFVNSFFKNKLLGSSTTHKKLARWFKGFKLIDMDMVFIACHVSGNHWCLLVINFTKKQFEWYDSMGGKNYKEVLSKLQTFITESTPGYSFSDWGPVYAPKNIPMQNNGSDCGVFMCKFADYMSENRALDFSSADMPYFRKRMLLELVANRVD